MMGDEKNDKSRESNLWFCGKYTIFQMIDSEKLPIIIYAHTHADISAQTFSPRWLQNSLLLYNRRLCKPYSSPRKFQIKA